MDPTDSAPDSCSDHITAIEAVVPVARSYLSGLASRPVTRPFDAAALLRTLDVPLEDSGVEVSQVLTDLADAVEPGLVTSSGPNHFGFVTGGNLPAAFGADWLTTVWDQNAGTWAMSPAAATVERVAASWLLDLLGLPDTASVGLATGAQSANIVALAAARHRVLQQEGWDVERRGLRVLPRFGSSPPSTCTSVSSSRCGCWIR